MLNIYLFLKHPTYFDDIIIIIISKRSIYLNHLTILLKKIMCQRERSFSSYSGELLVDIVIIKR